MNPIRFLNLIKLPVVVSVIGLSILFLIMSLFFPVFYTADGGQFYGFTVILIGWLAIMFANLGLGSIGWYANPLLLMAWLGLARPKLRVAGLVTLIVSIGIATCSLLMVHKTIEINEGGGTSEIVSIGIGFYIWLASFIICVFGYFITILVDLSTQRKTIHHNNEQND